MKVSWANMNQINIQRNYYKLCIRDKEDLSKQQMVDNFDKKDY